MYAFASCTQVYDPPFEVLLNCPDVARRLEQISLTLTVTNKLVSMERLLVSVEALDHVFLIMGNACTSLEVCNLLS